MPITDIVTPAYVREMLPTVSFMNPRTRAEISDNVFHASIDGAVNDMEERIGFSLRTDHRRQHVERKDTLEWHGDTYQLKKMLTRPLQSVTKLTLGFPEFPQGEVDIDRVYITSNRFGQLQIMPGALRFMGNVYDGSWGGYGGAGVTSDGHYLAAFIKVDYHAGFDVQLAGTHTVAASSSTVTVTDDTTEVAYSLEPGQYVKIGGMVRRIHSVVDAATYTVSTPFDSAYTGIAIHLTYPSIAIEAVTNLAAIPLLAAAGTLLYGAGVTGKQLHIDGMSQRKGINPLGPYAVLSGALKERAEANIRTLYGSYTPVRSSSY
jgi:hypothetical protein